MGVKVGLSVGVSVGLAVGFAELELLAGANVGAMVGLQFTVLTRFASFSHVPIVAL